MNETLVCFVRDDGVLENDETALFLQNALTAMEANPFAVFAEMHLENSPDSEPYQSEKLLKTLYGGSDKFAALKTSEPHPLTASIRLAPYILLQIIADVNYLTSEDKINQAVDFTNRLKKTLPNFSYGIVDAFTDISDFYDQTNLETLPECFNYYLSWKTLIDPRSYQAIFERADLLNAPAAKVEELADEIICLTAYPSLFDYKTPESQARIAELTNYLNKKRKDN